MQEKLIMFQDYKNAVMLDKKLKKMLRKNRLYTAQVMTQIGVTASCDVSNRSRQFRVICLDNEEYYLELDENEKPQATGRTCLVDDVLTIALFWLTGGTRESLYKKYSFIDKTLRAVKEIIKLLDMSQDVSGSQIGVEIVHDRCDVYSLELWEKKRHCKLYFAGHENPPGVEFYWCGTYLFSLENDDHKLLGEVLVRWLIEKVAPLELEQEFLWINLRKSNKENDPKKDSDRRPVS